jgi:6-pyruvoyltetrahydropterin/6-carboxytetrahydropterin synthase
VALLKVRHNIEVAHRLYEALPGEKCEQIHGHSMWVTLFIEGKVNDKGILAGPPRTMQVGTAFDDSPITIESDGTLDFGSIKKYFRQLLDETYDHRLLLNASDPFAGPILQYQKVDSIPGYREANIESLPGLQALPGDPTTENLAKWIYQDMSERYPVTKVEVWETSVNGIEYP